MLSRVEHEKKIITSGSGLLNMPTFIFCDAMQRKACYSFMHAYVNTIISRAGSFVDESGKSLLRSSVTS